MKQTYQMRRMTALQPKMKAIQDRYAKDPQTRSREMMKLYKTRRGQSAGLFGADGDSATDLDRTISSPA